MSKRLCIVLLLFSVLLPFVNGKTESKISTLASYFDLIVSGNTESAYYMWTDESRERASRFGITYENIPLKIDCYSPIVKNPSVMQDYLQPPVKKTAFMPGGFSTLLYSAIVDGNLVEYTYHMVEENDFFWLTNAQDCYTVDWEIVESKYFRIHYNKDLEQELNEIALQEADNFIESITKKMKFSKDDIKLLAEKKIEYIFCASDKQVEEITGHLVKGTYDMPSNDIISAFFPHYHEIVHLLVNFKLKRLPLYALPILREGTAVHFGGRWGKNPEALALIGEFLISENIISVDSIITFSQFNKVATSNIAYSVAGLFSSYLIDKMGIDDYFALYRETCGELDDLLDLSSDELKQKFAVSVKLDDWESVQKDFESYLDKIVANANMSPGITEKGKDIFNTKQAIIRADKDYYTFEISAVNDTVCGNIIFDLEEKLQNKRSSLFEEQYKMSQEFSGYRFGIRYDRNEVGVYDYATNHLMAKYIWSLTPSESYYNENEHKLYFKFSKDVLPFELDKNIEFKILPN